MYLTDDQSNFSHIVKVSKQYFIGKADINDIDKSDSYSNLIILWN